MLRIAFWGLGSIAKRHIQNLSDILSHRRIEFQIDVYRHTINKTDDVPQNTFEYNDQETSLSTLGPMNVDCHFKDLISTVYYGSNCLQKQYDITFITNPTALHFETIKKCVSNTRHMFIEKPVFDKPDISISELGLQKGNVYYVACPLRYTAVLRYIKEKIDLSSVYSVRAISSSYLPEWRPQIDYRNTYSARKALGGGVAIDLIHEWDYVTSLFGKPNKVFYAGGRFSSLEIDSDDLAAYIGIYDQMLAEIHLDYFGRKTIREATFFTEQETITADIANNKVMFSKDDRTISFQEERNDYQKRELCHFLDIIEGKCENDNSVENALDILKLAIPERNE